MATARRVIQIDVTTSPQVRTAVKQLNSQLRSIEGSSKRAARSLSSMQKGVGLLNNLAGIFIGMQAARAVTDLADTMTLLSARVNLVAEATVGVNKAMDDLFTVSSMTRSSIEASGSLYARLGLATQQLGVSHEDLLKVVQTTANTLLLSGAGAQEAKASMIQLSQAFAKGRLDGDEFRTMTENNVYMFDLLAKGLNTTRKELFRMSKAGELTTEKVLRVLIDAAEETQQKVAEIPFTFGQAFTQIHNEFARLALESTAELEAITNAVLGLITHFRTLKDVISDQARFFAAFRSGDISLGEFLFSDIDEIRAKLNSLSQQESPFKKFADDSEYFANKIVALGTEITTLQAQMEYRQDVGHTSVASAIQQRINEATEEMKNLRGLVDETTGTLNEANKLAAAAKSTGGFFATGGAGYTSPSASAPPPSSGGSKKRSGKTEAEKFAESLQRLQDRLDPASAKTRELMQDIQLLDRAFFDGQISAERYDLLIKTLTTDTEALADAQEALAKDRSKALSFIADLDPGSAIRDQIIEVQRLREKFEELSPAIAESLIEVEFSLQDNLEATLDDIKDQVDKTTDYAKDLGLTFTSAFEDAIVEGKNLQDVLKGLEQDIIRIISRKLVTEPLGNAISGAFDGEGLLGSIFSKLGFAAEGGPVYAGRPYIVGEQGPELFVPRGAGGNIVPNNELGGTTVINVNIASIPSGGNPESYRLSARQGALEGSRLLNRARSIS